MKDVGALSLKENEPRDGSGREEEGGPEGQERADVGKDTSKEIVRLTFLESALVIESGRVGDGQLSLCVEASQPLIGSELSHC
jgi:hypothetical protein